MFPRERGAEENGPNNPTFLGFQSPKVLSTIVSPVYLNVEFLTGNTKPVAPLAPTTRTRSVPSS